MTEKNIPAKQSFYAKIALVTATVIWGGSFVVIKNAVNDIPPILILALRFTIGAAILAIIFFRRLKNINKRYLLNGCFLGILLFTAYAFQTIGITMTTPGKNAFLTTVYCVLVPFLYWILEKRKPGANHFAAAFICITGIGFVSLNERFLLGTGDLLTLICGVFYALHMYYISRFTQSGNERDAIVYTILQFTASAIIAWLGTGLFETFPARFTPDMVFAIAYLAGPTTALALCLQAVGQKYTHPAVASILLSLESVFGVLFSAAFYGERLTIRIIIGFALIFLSVAISENGLPFTKRRKPVLKKADKDIFARMRPFLEKERDLSIFFFGDVENFGLDGSVCAVYYDDKDGEFLTAILHFGDSATIFTIEEEPDIKALVIFLKTLGIRTISGQGSVMEKMAGYFPAMNLKSFTLAHLDAMNSDKTPSSHTVRQLNENDMDKILELYSTIVEFGDVYANREKTIVNIRRNMTVNGRGYGAFDGGTLTSVAFTTASCSIGAVVIGVATLPAYRKKGYASAVMRLLCESYVNEGKFLCLFYNNPQAFGIYKKLGFKEAGGYSMLN